MKAPSREAQDRREVTAEGGIDYSGVAVYIHRMIRTQLYLDEALHQRLRALSRKQGRTVSDLVREALVKAYGTSGPSEMEKALEGIAGLWKDRDDLGSTRAYVRRLRDGTRRRKRLRG